MTSFLNDLPHVVIRVCLAAFVPVLPRPMLGVLAAPTPFLLGAHTTWLRDLQTTPEVRLDPLLLAQRTLSPRARVLGGCGRT